MDCAGYINRAALADVSIHGLHLLAGSVQCGAVQLVDLRVGVENRIIRNAQHQRHLLPGGKARQADDPAQAFRLKILRVQFAVDDHIHRQLFVCAGNRQVRGPRDRRGKVHLHGAFLGHAKGRLHAYQRRIFAAGQALQHGVLQGKGVVVQRVGVHGQRVPVRQIRQRECGIVLI